MTQSYDIPRMDPECEMIFWIKFEQYTRDNSFDPWVATLMVNHYHVVGFAHSGRAVGQMMRKLHGSVATLVCKQLAIQHKPFWQDNASNDYMDGCLRNECSYAGALFMCAIKQFVLGS